jgi:hypothetical protein
MLRTEVSNKLIDFSYLTTKIWLEREEDESTCKQDLQKRIELINWALETMKNPNIPICSVIESKMNEIIERVKQTYYLKVIIQYRYTVDTNFNGYLNGIKFILISLY